MPQRFRPAGEQQAEENLRRLHMYDEAQNMDARRNAAADRLDFQRQKQAFEEAFKTSEAERKAAQFEATSQMKQQHIDTLNERLKLKDEIDQNNNLLRQQAELAKEKATVAKQNAALDFYKQYPTLDPQSPDFRQKLSETMGKVYSNLVDTQGNLPPDISKAVDNLMNRHDAWQATQQTRAQQANPVQALQDSLAASKPIYGVADAKGQNFNATQAGTDAQTHVQTTYLPPGAKKPVTEVFPRDVFDSMVAASTARNQPQTSPQAVAPTTTAAAVPPAAPVGAPTPTGEDTVQNLQQAKAPVIPQGAIDHLQKNPDLADFFDQKYGQGASQQYLQRRE